MAGRAILVSLALAAPPAVPAAFAQPPTVDGPLPTPLPLLPSDNWWNLDITQAPLDPNSANFISFINNGGSRRLHPDWGGSAQDPDDPLAIFGIPYVVVPGSQPLVSVTFEFDDESDVGAPGRPAGYPIPEEVKTQAGWMEGGAPGGSTSPLPSANGDRHLLLVDRDNRILYELFALRWNAAANRWEAGSGAIFPLTTNHRRPDGWTSADAAGLAMLPGLVRYDEAFGIEPIRHAFRVTVRRTNGYVFPASHRAGSTQGALPMGARLRMKANVDLTPFPASVRRVLQAMKTYGLIVADNGSDMFITGTSDPRWQAQMGSFVSIFHALNANMFEVVQLGWQPTVAPDADADGLPTAWEEQFGLNPNNAATNEGPDGDPDEDGASNAAELANGTHPRGFEQRYFAEGVSNGFFSTQVAAMNPGSEPSHVLFRFLRHDGIVVPHAVTVPPRGRITFDPATLAGLERATFGAAIESDRFTVVDRTVTWDSRGYGSHGESSVPARSTTWFLAEGSTSGAFQLYYLLQNPNDVPTTATVRYLLPFDAPITKTYPLPANSRTTIEVETEDPMLLNSDVSAEITTTEPIIVERAMYLSRPGEVFGAGHDSAGVTQPATEWFLAEGSTGTFFDLFVLIVNPTNQQANVRTTYLLPGGATLEKTYPVRANSRETIYVDIEEFDGVRALAATPVSVKLTSTNGVPVVVERTMWWPDGGWYEGHNTPGSTKTGTRWGFADGEQGGPTGSTQTFLLIANTSAHEGEARVTLFFEGGGEESRTYRLPPNSRTNVDCGGDFPLAANRRFGSLVESIGTAPAQIFVERAMYASIGGLQWSAGTNAAATPIP